MYKIGDQVIYSMPKVSAKPGARAHDVYASMRGENYEYVVEKFWTVVSVVDPGQIEIVTRRGKTRTIRTDDPRLRRAGLFTRLAYRKRFPVLDGVVRPVS